MLKDTKTAFRVATKLPEGVAQGHIGTAKEIKISVDGVV